MRTTRNTVLLAGAVAFFAACGGSGNGDVTITTDNPPAGAAAGTVRTAPMNGPDASVGAQSQVAAGGMERPRAEGMASPLRER